MSKISNFVFCSLSDRPEFSKPMFQHLQQYCNKHDYKCVLENNTLDNSRAPSWSKIPLIKREMKNNPNSEYIVWIDDDIIVTNKNKKFDELIKPYPFDNLLISQEVEEPFNCGILVCKNNDETYKYLEYIWNLCEKDTRYKWQPNWEQAILIKDYRETQLNNPNQSTITTIPYKIIQSFFRGRNPDWKLGDFSAHITGMPLDKRIHMRDIVLSQI